MSLNQINRLFDKTNEDLILCQQKIDNWNKFLDDYTALETRLATIADKTRHNVMVPIAGTNMAFMDGYIKHSNEVLVLLGDNYFVERSAKQAKEIAGRRISKCRQMIDELNKERTHLKNWLTFSKQFGDETQNQDFVEIMEEYNEQKEKEWKEKHRRRVREYKLSQKSDEKSFDETEVFKRLEELEIGESSPQKQELKSILKKSIQREESDKIVAFDEAKTSVPTAAKEEPKNESNETPFKNEVIERDIDSDLVSGEAVSSVEMKSSPKIVSRFKANRMKK